MIEFTDENFEKEISTTKKPVLVDFWAEWCFPCKVLTPILENLSRDFEEKIIFAKVNIDNAPLAAQKYGIDRIPMVILFKEGKPVSGFVGVRPEAATREILNQMLNDNPSTTQDEESKEDIEKIIKNYQEYAEKNGFKLNPNREVVERLVKGLLNNEKKYGKRYCPCRRVTGNKEEDEKNVCPCAFHLDEIEKNGHCFCGLFIK
jgi:thioredoxin